MMTPSSPSLEPCPFLEPEKASSSRSSASIAQNLLRQVGQIPDRLRRASKLCNVSSLLPSFLQPRSKSENRKVSQTAWLDGMRGLAAFFVYVRHFASATHPAIQVGYGTDADNRYLIQLPILHLVVSGPAMVAIFFIVSGYALSWGSLRSMHLESASAGLKKLSSGTFRRALRLFLPGVVSTFIIMLCISAGLYDKGHASVNPEDMPGFMEPQPPMLRNDPFLVQLRDWINWTWVWLQVWTSTSHPYDVHLWTLPIEFRCSMILFLALVGYAKTAPVVRLGLLFCSILYCQFTNFWQGWLFFAGSFLAQLKLMQGETTEENVSPISLAESGGMEGTCDEKPKKRRSYFSKADFARFAAFTAGLYLLSAPDYGFAATAPGYRFISTLNPPLWPENWRFPHCIGAILAVYATSSTSTNAIRCLFDNPVSVYLGKLSYALYLVHGPVVHMLGFWLVPWFWSLTGKETQFQKELGFMGAFVVVTALVIWSADLFWRGVDNRCVALARWLENMVAVGD